MTTISNSNFQKIISLLKISGKIEGRTKFQKIIYILKNKGISFNEKFKYHYFGPFSIDLQLEIDELVDRNILVEKGSNPYNYELSKEYDCDYDSSQDFFANKKLIQFLNELDYKKLEVISTIYFLESKGIYDKKILRKKLVGLKPHLSSIIECSFELKDEINSM